MITYETLKTFLGKVKESQAEIEKMLAIASDSVEKLEKDHNVHQGQIITLEQLLDIENNPPTVEMNIIDEDTMSEEHENRLGFFEGGTPNGFFEERKDATYKREAVDTAHKIDELNKNPE